MQQPSRRAVAALLPLAAATVLVAPGPRATAAPATRWVDVSVTTLWSAPGLARPIDAPALANPADPRRWVASMTDAQKRWLSGHTQTQALYGTRVLVLATRGAWTKVAVPSQPSPKDARGYPGWMPTRQLTSRAPIAAATTGVVRTRTTWLWNDPVAVGNASGRVVELSYGTRLPVVSADPTTVQVAMLGGDVVHTLRRSVVVLQTAGGTTAPSGSAVVAEALRFLRLPYLWAGTSGFALDCSGLTYAAYRQLGVTIPRDAAVQATHGTPVARRELRPGDLVFVQNAAGVVHHVAMYVGRRHGARTVIEAPHTGAVVRLRPLSQWTWQYAGARRYL